MKNLSTVEFNNVIENQSKAMVIDLYASWCQPCKNVAISLEDLQKSYTNVDFYKIDIEEENEIAAKYQVRSVPTLLFIDSNGNTTVKHGAIPKNKIEEEVKKLQNSEVLV